MSHQRQKKIPNFRRKFLISRQPKLEVWIQQILTFLFLKVEFRMLRLAKGFDRFEVLQLKLKVWKLRKTRFAVLLPSVVWMCLDHWQEKWIGAHCHMAKNWELAVGSPGGKWLTSSEHSGPRGWKILPNYKCGSDYGKKSRAWNCHSKFK